MQMLVSMAEAQAQWSLSILSWTIKCISIFFYNVHLCSVFPLFPFPELSRSGAAVQVVPDLISCSSAIASCSAEWRMALALFDTATTAMAPDVPISNALLMSFSSHWKMAMRFLLKLAGLRIRGDEITQNLASDSYIKGTQWPSALWLFHLDHHLPARVLPLDQWQAALRTLGSFITPERVSQAAEHVSSAQKWQLALAIFEQMDLVMATLPAKEWWETPVLSVT